ncbi:MAG: low-complexity protein [Chromatiales bacterium]|nr:low-complexity protein [Chromatiales bacterium]
MSKKQLKSSITLTATSIALGLATAPIAAQAETNPFGMTALSSGYMVVADAKGTEGKCGEGKCGGSKSMEKKSDGKCGEGKCGGSKSMDKKMEGKCGEGKCGGSN